MEQLNQQDFMGMVVLAVASQEPSSRFTLKRNLDNEQVVLVELRGVTYELQVIKRPH